MALEVIVRSEADYDGEGFHWVAVFPCEPANYGRLEFVPFIIKNGKVFTCEAFGEMTLSWYYGRTKYVRPTVLESYGVYDALNEWYKDEDVKLKFRQKLPQKFNWR